MRQIDQSAKSGRMLGGGWIATSLYAVTGIVFSYWVTSMQLDLVGPAFSDAYPWSSRLQSMAEVFGLFAIGVLSSLTLTRQALPYIPLPKLATASAIAWMLILASPLGMGLGASVMLSILAHLILIYSLTPAGIWNEKLWKLGPHLIALGIIVVAVTFSATMVSPFHQQAPLTVYRVPSQGDLHIFSPLYKSYIWSKFFSFSDIDYSAWGAVPNVVTNLRSVPAMLATLLLDLPSIDVKSFHRLITFLVYLIFIFGSFGFYLFARIGLQVRFGIAVLGSIPFILANIFFQHSFNGDYLFFVSSYALLPYALLGINVAIKKNSPLAAAWTGVALALPFYVLAPHPEAVIHAMFAFILISLFWLLIKTPQVSFVRKFVLMSISALTALGLSAAHLFPIVDMTATGNMITFGHLSGVFAAQPPTGLLHAFLPYGLTGAVFMIPSLWAQYIKRKPVPEYWGLAVASIIILTILVQYRDGPIAAFISWSELPIYFIGPHRVLMYPFLAVLVFMMLGVNTLLDFKDGTLTLSRQKASFGLHALYNRFVTRVPAFLIYGVGALGVFLINDPNGYLKTGHKIGNPAGCSYYISLRANLANFDNLARDTANIEYLRHRLQVFEGENKPDQPAFQTGIKNYRKALLTFDAKSIDDVSDDLVIDVVRASWRHIDNAYLNKGGCLYPPMVDGDNTTPKRISRFNNDSLYADIPDRYARIISATGRTPGPEIKRFETSLAGDRPRITDSHLGLGSGRFINNGMTTLDSRFMMGFPLLHALYLYPNYHFDQRGTYQDLMHWKFDAQEILEPRSRKLLDIAGIDVITVRAENLKDNLDFTGFQELNIDIPDVIDPHYTPLGNGQSYGMAYLADSVVPISRQEIASNEELVKDYFRHRLDKGTYIELVESMRQKLLDLPGKHAVLLEQPAGATPVFNVPIHGEAHIVGMAGPRVHIASNCNQPSCLLVFNQAALPGWRIFVDHEAKPTLRANYAFLAVQVPQGRHDVVFIYEPFPQSLGMALSLIFMLLILGWTLARKR